MKISKNQEEKRKKIEEFKNKIDGKSLIFVDYQGIKVEEISSLRSQLRENGATIRVIKNTLLKRVSQEKKIDFDDDLFKGMMATAIIDNEKFINVSKDIYSTEKDEKLKIKGGFFDGEVLNHEMIRKYAKMFSKEDLYNVLVGCLSSIVSNLVFVLDDIAKQVMKVSGGNKESQKKNEVNQEKKKEKKEEENESKVENKP